MAHGGVVLGEGHGLDAVNVVELAAHDDHAVRVDANYLRVVLLAHAGYQLHDLVERVVPGVLVRRVEYPAFRVADHGSALVLALLIGHDRI